MQELPYFVLSWFEYSTGQSGHHHNRNRQVGNWIIREGEK